MNTNLLDECFGRRMDVLRGRFPLEDFKRLFVNEFARVGMVYIQTATLDLTERVVCDNSCGIIFADKRHVDTAVRLLRRWGFKVDLRTDPEGEKTSAYAAILPEDYLRKRLGSENVGHRRTSLRTLDSYDLKKEGVNATHGHHRQEPPDYQ